MCHARVQPHLLPLPRPHTTRWIVFAVVVLRVLSLRVLSLRVLSQFTLDTAVQWHHGSQKAWLLAVAQVRRRVRASKRICVLQSTACGSVQ